MDQQSDRQELWEEYITERISQILQAANLAGHKEIASFWNQLSKEMQQQIEAWEDANMEWKAEENREIYKTAFLDGLYLGTVLFWSEK